MCETPVPIDDALAIPREETAATKGTRQLSGAFRDLFESPEANSEANKARETQLQAIKQEREKNDDDKEQAESIAKAVKQTEKTWTKPQRQKTSTNTTAPRRSALNDNFVKINLKKGWRRKTKAKRFKGGNEFLNSRKRKFDDTGAESQGNLSRTASFVSLTIKAGNSKRSYRAKDSAPRDTIQDCVESLERKEELSESCAPAPKGQVPLCTGHQLPCTLHTVKKKSANHGRQFYSCSERSRFGGGCGYFSWVDDCKDIALKEFTTEQSKEDFHNECISDLLDSWQKTPVDELKSLLRKHDLSTKGKKGDLIERLEKCARKQAETVQTLNQQFSAEADLSEHIHTTLESVFGYDEFRFDQQWAVERVLQGKSTLLVQSTGSGKSLCYQLPAALLPGLTIVISPLISLMEDQMKSLPLGLPGACLSGRQSAVETARILKRLRNNAIKVLFVSPERLFTSSFQRLVRTPGENIYTYPLCTLWFSHECQGLMPSIDLVCVDEVRDNIHLFRVRANIEQIPFRPTVSRPGPTIFGPRTYDYVRC